MKSRMEVDEQAMLQRFLLGREWLEETVDNAPIAPALLQALRAMKLVGEEIDELDTDTAEKTKILYGDLQKLKQNDASQGDIAAYLVECGAQMQDLAISMINQACELEDNLKNEHGKSLQKTFAIEEALKANRPYAHSMYTMFRPETVAPANQQAVDFRNLVESKLEESNEVRCGMKM